MIAETAVEEVVVIETEESMETEEESAESTPEPTETKDGACLLVDAIKDDPASTDTPPPDIFRDHLNEIGKARGCVSRCLSDLHSIKEDLKEAKESYEDAVNDLMRLIDRGPNMQPPLPLSGDVRDKSISNGQTKRDDKPSKPINGLNCLLTQIGVEDGTRDCISLFQEDYPDVETVQDWLNFTKESEKHLAPYFSDSQRQDITSAINLEIHLGQSESTDDISWRSVRLADLHISESIVKTLFNSNLSITTVGELSDYTSTGREIGSIKGIGPAKATKIEEALDRFWADRNSKEST